MTERVLVIGAHCDDESFGCLGTMLKHKEAKDKISFLWFTEARNTWQGAKQVRDYFNSAEWGFLELKDQRLDTYPLMDIIEQIEIAIKAIEPTIVYCPFIGDLNRDHRIVAEATMVACRPYLPNAPKEVRMYAIAGTTELGLREFKADRQEMIDPGKKIELIQRWYPGELINGRQKVSNIEVFERWPQCDCFSR